MILIIIFFVGVFHLLTLSQLTFTAWPEMLSYPYLFSNDFTLYKDFIMPYPPGLVLILAIVFNNFGFSLFVLKTFTWILILLTDLLIYLILKKISKNNTVAILFLLIYVFLQSVLDGNMLWFDFAAVLPLLLGFYFCLEWLNKQNYKSLFLISLFLSISVMIKQVNVIYFFSFGLIYFFQRRKIVLREIFYLITGGLIMFIPLIFYIFKINAVLEFWNWVILYPITEWSKFPGYVNFNISKRQIATSFILFFPLFVSIIYWKQFIKDKIFLIILLFLSTALITVYPRFSFFHLQPAITFLIIIFAKIFIKIPQRIKYLYLLLVLLVVSSIMLVTYKSVMSDQIRFYNKEDIRLTENINQATRNTKKIYFLGINSSEYVFANKIPPKNWSDNFGWYLEIPGIQEWVITGFENDPPIKIIWRIPSKGQWFELGVYQPQQIIEYIKKHYQKTGNIESGIEIWERN